MKDAYLSSIENVIEIKYDELPTRAKSRLHQICRLIGTNHGFHNVSIVSIEDIKVQNKKIHLSKLTFSIKHASCDLHPSYVDVILTRGIRDTTPDEVLRRFNIEYTSNTLVNTS